MKNSLSTEFRAHWNVLVASILGIGFGAISLPTVSISIFLHDIQDDLGWSRTSLSFTSTVVTLALAASSPVVGWLADRFRTSTIVGSSMLMLGLGFFAISRTGSSFGVYLLVFAVTAVLAAGTSTIPYARAISISFVSNRGKALGLSMLGNGLTGIFLPMLLVPLVAASGWRIGFIVVGCIAVVIAPIVFGLMRFRESTPERDRGSAQKPSIEDIGLSPKQALRHPAFRTLLFVFAFVSLGASGIQIHFPSIAADRGLSPEAIALFTSSLGVGLVVARLLVGYLLDRFNARLVSAAAFGCAAIAVLLFSIDSPGTTIFGAIAVGLSVGTEVDMIGYFASRYFGFSSYGKIYGLLYMSVLITTAFSPVLYGLSADITGSYSWAFWGSAILFAISAVGLLRLNRIPYVENVGLTSEDSSIDIETPRPESFEPAKAKKPQVD
jgi:OFA family oxalate/formate antiporter-like MFS transporter